MKKYLLASLLTASLCTFSITAAHAAPHWISIPKSDTRSTYWLDANSIEPDAEHADWKKVDLMLEPKEAPSVRGQAASTVIATTIDCTRNTGRVDELRFYDQPHAQGKLLDTVPGRDTFRRFEFNHDKGNAFMLSTVCQ